MAEQEAVAQHLSPRLAVVDLLRKRLTERHQVVKGGTMDGLGVVTVDDIEAALAEPLPPASSNAAEIVTPGSVTVVALCPECGIATDILLSVGSELRTDIEGSEIRLKGKSKARAHIHGQQRFGDGLFELADIVGESDDGGSIETLPTDEP